jgi:cell division protein FtsL
LAAAVLSVVALVALYSSIDHLQDQYDALRQQALQLESNNGQLQQQINELGTLDSIIRIAMEELGLTFPDSVIFAPKN